MLNLQPQRLAGERVWTRTEVQRYGEQAVAGGHEGAAHRGDGPSAAYWTAASGRGIKGEVKVDGTIKRCSAA